MTNEQKDFTNGLIVGICITIFVWFFTAHIVEDIKVKMGYLTCRNRIYVVKLYDSLEKPVKEKK